MRPVRHKCRFNLLFEDFVVSKPMSKASAKQFMCNQRLGVFWSTREFFTFAMGKSILLMVIFILVQRTGCIVICMHEWKRFVLFMIALSKKNYGMCCNCIGTIPAKPGL